MLDYAMLATAWTEDSEGLDIANRSWFRVLNGLLGRVTEFFETDGTPYYAIDVYVLALNGSVVYQEVLHPGNGQRIGYWDAWRTAEKFMLAF